MLLTWNENNTLSIGKPSKPKKITGTRFASILGANVWNTPFKTWCELTRTYDEPFTDSKYTIAGKTIEPLQHEYMRKNYGMSNLVSPEDVYGQDFFSKTHGDFYPQEPVFGGMWDALLVNADNTVDAVLEFKTTSRPEDWATDIPEYYAMQGSLYAYLLGTSRVIMVCSFLYAGDYEHPENFKANVSNTIVREFDLWERYPDFEEKIRNAEKFYKQNVLGGVSPEFTEKDENIIKELRTTHISNDSALEELIKEAEKLKAEIDEHNEKIASSEKRYKLLTDEIKNRLVSDLDNDTDTITVSGVNYLYEVKKSLKTDINKKALEKDGLLEKYQTSKEQYTLRVKELRK